MTQFQMRRGFEMVLATGWLAFSLIAWAQPAAAQSPPKAAVKKPSQAEKPGVAARKPNEKLAEPATPEEAAKVLDLRTIPIMVGAKVSSQRSLGMLMYSAKATPKAAFEFQRQMLLKRGFKELPGSTLLGR